MKTISKSLIAVTLATGLLGATAVVAQDQEPARAHEGQGMMDGMQGEGMQGMHGMMGMMSQMSEMMESCNEMMEAMKSRQDTPETEAPRKG